MSLHHYYAFDLGASSGRTILGTLDNGKLDLKEIARFPNGVINIRGHFYWDIFRIFEELKKSLETCVYKNKVQVESLGIDTWGVDFVLLGRDGSLAGAPYSYRDIRTNGVLEDFEKNVMPLSELYDHTGIQMMQFNSIFQLYAMQRDRIPQLEIATDLLFIPDYLNYLFTGEKKAEFSIASTSQLMNPFSRQWDSKLFKSIGVSENLMQDIVQTGSIIGQLDKTISKETGMKSIPVIAVAEHDTGSAIAAVPAEGENWAYMSSGTWSLMGIELDQPLINEATARYNFTNEGGVNNTSRFLKNISGLFLIEQCKRSWSVCNDYSYDQIVDMAKAAKPFQSFIEPDAPDFMCPLDMPDAILAYCKRTNQSVPTSHGEISRLVYESLAMKYKYVFNRLREISPKPLEKLHIIGGGSKNKFLCQLTADALGVPVIAGPGEGTAIGNIIVQAMAMGHISSLAEARAVIRNSFELETFQPQNTPDWDKAYERFMEITKLP